MPIMKFSTAVKKEILLFDGAMGTMLQERGLAPGAPPESLNLSQPSWVAEVHQKYVAAGAQVLETNTFGGNRLKLSAFGLEGQLKKINARAVAIAKKVAGNYAYVAASIGPSGQFLEPLGPLSFQEAREVFKEQAQALSQAGADVLLFETFTDIKELRAAVIGAREASELPIIASLTYEPNGRTLLGTSPLAAAVTLSGLGITAIGMNCGLGPEEAKAIAAEYAQITNLPILIMPNAGLPRLEGNKTVFPATPREMAAYMKIFLQLGVTLVGGCCGTTPQHITAMRAALNKAGASRGTRDAVHLHSPALYLSSRTQVVAGGYGRSPLIIGERINPTNRKLLSRELSEGKTSLLRQEAMGQRDAGAQLLDVNVGVPQIDEPGAMKKAVWAIQRAVDCPLVLDSPQAATLEAGLQAADGRVLINSINGEAKALETLLPLAKKYGAAFIALCLDEKGIPPRPEDRLKVARRILRAAKALGLKAEDVAVDTLTLAASAEPQGPQETLRTLALIKSQLGLPTVLGVSNVSFGLPNRERLNAAFLTMALAGGLDLAIINPYKTEVMEAFLASQVLLRQDEGAKQYIRRQSLALIGDAIKGETQSALPLHLPAKLREGKGRLYEAIFNGEKEQVRELVAEALDGGMSPLEVVNQAIIPSLGEMGELFGKGECFLPQVMMAAEAAQTAFSHLRQALGQEITSSGRILLATVEGDIHDIGKNIVASLLESNGFEVLDLGKNVPATQIVKAAREQEVDIIGLSALMTTTMNHMQEVVKERDRQGLKIPIMVGGAVVTAEFARQIGADDYAPNALEAVNIAKKIVPAKL
jgi:5-methyltetrahydrofolate--homocysteine methyltransferase